MTPTATLTPGALWGETAAAAGLRLHRIAAVDDRTVTLVVVRDANGTPAKREKRTRLLWTRFLRSYAPVGLAPSRTPAPEWLGR